MKVILRVGILWACLLQFAEAKLTVPGTYSGTGQQPGTNAPVGFYVPDYGATRPTPAPPGSFVPVEGTSRATRAPQGSYVAFYGQSSPTLAEPGSYVSLAGATVATKAPPGSYVAVRGATAPTLASPGSYVAMSGATVATKANPGYYVPFPGATTALSCPPGTTSYVASVGCRIIDETVSRNPPQAVGPVFSWLESNPVFFEDGSSPVSFAISLQNKSSDLSAASELTALTVLDGYFVGSDASYFSVSNKFPATLHEGEDLVIGVTYSGLAKQGASAQLYLLTDENASVGEKGEVQLLTVTGDANSEPTEPGTYSETGLKPGTPAPVGTYVSGYGATSPTPASPGYYVPTVGASYATAASPGHFVAEPAASSQMLSPVGHFVVMGAATNATPAPVGTFVDVKGATTVQQASPGYYVPTVGASFARAAQPGMYVPNSGASAATPADPGHYVSTAGASKQVEAQPGTFVPTTGASAATLVAPGYFVPVSGATTAWAAQPGTYVPFSGATSGLMCPPGTTSYVASAGCRIIESSVSNNPPHAVGPAFVWQETPPVVFDNEAGPVSFTLSVQNASADLGAESELTALTLLNAFFVGTNHSFFAISDSFPMTLYEGKSVDVHVTYSGPIDQDVRVQFYLLTDQFASVGENGKLQSLAVAGAIDADHDGLSSVDEEVIGTSDSNPDTDGDGFGDYIETLYDFLDPLVDNSDLRTFAQDNRELFALFSSSDILEGQVGELVLQPQPGGGFRLQWTLEATTNLVSGAWEPVSTNEVTVAPGGPGRGFFRIQIQDVE